MITYELATENQYEEFLKLMLDHMADYLETLMELMGMSIDEFDHLLRKVGQVYCVKYKGEVAGFYWVEERGREIHLHGIILKEEYQGKGIGTKIFEKLEKQYQNEKELIELGVHISNEGAIRLYEKLGYETEITKEELGFYIMRKHL
jgi:ribosomal protein S18 acetylase RimI-like enzyme